ncbi:MAG: acyl--CoA ligase [Haliea sp.]|nr:acyl--CoA ligase [Haliea sp.]
MSPAWRANIHFFGKVFMLRKTAANPTGFDRLSDVVAAHALHRPDRIAFIEEERQMSWLSYHEAANRLAVLLVHLGYRRGDMVAVLMPDSLETHIAFLACERAGLVAVAITPRAGVEEIRHISSISDARCLITKTEYRAFAAGELFKEITRNPDAKLKQHIIIDGPAERYVVDGEILENLPSTNDAAGLPGTAPDEIFLLNTTSGTTGMPKCVKQHQARWFAYAEYVHDACGATDKDVFMRAIPSSVGFGLWSGHFTPTLLGATTVILPGFTVERMLAGIENHKVSVLAAVSTQFLMALNSDAIEKYDLSSLAVLFTGGEAVPFAKAAEFEDRVGAKVLQFYGSNECGAISYTKCSDTRERRLNTAGHVIQAMDVSVILDSAGNSSARTGLGQPLCRGPLMSFGYYNDEQGNSRLFSEEGFMLLEDKVEIDQFGYLRVIGRIGDFIIRGGKNISAVAVENYALKHPAVKLAAALPVPDPVYGERVGLAVVLEEGASLDLGDVVSFLLEQEISKSYFPEKLFVLNEIPMGSGGKVAKHELRRKLFPDGDATE